MTEQEERFGLRNKRIRLVLNKNRAKKLRNRGENIWWSVNFNGWLWTPDWDCPIRRLQRTMSRFK